MLFATTLGAIEHVQARPFTDPGYISADADLLRYLARQLHLMLSHPARQIDVPRTYCMQPAGATHWEQRNVFVQPLRLREIRPISVVGFFGQRRADADGAAAAQFDATLLTEFPQQPDLLSYSTTLLADGNYANLVLFAREEGLLHWSRGAAHAQVASVFAPNYYQTVRIYNGVLPAGIASPETLHVTRAKYFDYRSQPLWHAVRELA
jgi:hypothetical protein